ncbi:MAG: hypothetical protein EA355_14780 [Rhodobacteraceae bacterium]|nr:MAG: hypothetical protein EA355_14780 [Paracoccaceae bacterium]
MRALALLLPLTLAACGVREIAPNPYVQRPPTAMRTIYVDPAGGEAAAAVGAALGARGFDVAFAPSTPRRPDFAPDWRALAAEGADGLLTVSGDGPDMPTTLTAVVRHTGDGAVVASVTWRTRFADQIGGLGDRLRRRDRDAVAAPIADALAAQIARGGPATAR